MYEVRKTIQVVAEMRRYNLAILRTNEARWIGSSQKRLATGDLLLFSGHDEVDMPYMYAVALILSKKAQRMLISWKAYGPQIITACFHTKKRRLNMDIIQYDTLTNDRKRGVLQEIDDHHQEMPKT